MSDTHDRRERLGDALSRKHADWLDDLPSLDVGPGWWRLVSETLDAMAVIARRESARVRITDFKEKYGSLRISWQAAVDEPAWSEIETIADAAESRSETTCDECGAPGKLREGAWIRALCDVHAGVRR